MREDETETMLYRQGGQLSKVSNPKAGKYGAPPAILLINPKYPHNVGSVVRAASCYGIEQVWYTGNRVALEVERKFRLPREERMKGYGDVTVFQNDRPLDQFKDCVPVCVELKDGAEELPWFEHPKNAVYVFGPEDGSVGPDITRLCHKFVVIPTKHCLNLASAVFTVLYARMLDQDDRYLSMRI